MAELSWSSLLLLLPLVFAVGWVSARIDLRQVRRAEADSPRAYYKGLNLLLNEQQDKAIDAFIEAVQHDPNTTELHFALGNLFRRRGEFERSVRVHQHLLGRADVSAADRHRAQHALAQDYMKAGLFDRAEAAYLALEATAFATEARQALLGLYERSHEWARAHDMAEGLEQAGAGSYALRRAHHRCEQALELRAATPGDPPSDAAMALVQQAHELAPQAPRPLVLAGQWWVQRGHTDTALATWGRLLRLPHGSLDLVAPEVVAAVQAPGQEAHRAAAVALLKGAYAQQPSTVLLQALRALGECQHAPELLSHLQQRPSLSAAALVLQQAPSELSAEALRQVQHTIDRHSAPLQRYRCAACGFEAHRYFWQCPGCLTWDSYPPQRIEDL